MFLRYTFRFLLPTHKAPSRARSRSHIAGTSSVPLTSGYVLRLFDLASSTFGGGLSWAQGWAKVGKGGGLSVLVCGCLWFVRGHLIASCNCSAVAGTSNARTTRSPRSSTTAGRPFSWAAAIAAATLSGVLPSPVTTS